MKACPYCAEQIQEAAIKCRHCGSNLPRTATPASASLEHLESREIAVICGAAAVVVAPFFSWVHVVLLGDLNLFNLISAGHSSPLWALIPMGLAISVIVAVVRHSPRARMLGLIAAVVAIIVDGLLLIALLHSVRHAYGFAQVRLGPWIGVGGAVVVLWASATRRSANGRQSPFRQAPR